MINIVFCDDEPNYLKYMKDKVSSLIKGGSFADFDYNIIVFDNSSEALEYCRDNDVHIAFVDIDMPQVNGFDIAAVFKSKKADTKVVFVSNYDNLVYSSIKYRPFRFIKKNCFDDEIKEAVNCALDELIIEGRYWNMGKRYNYEKVLLSDILYIESCRNDLLFYCVNDVYVVRDTLLNIENKLKDFYFVRIHSGFIVNLKYVKGVKNYTVLMTNNVNIPMSRQYRDKFSDLLDVYLMK